MTDSLQFPLTMKPACQDSSLHRPSTGDAQPLITWLSEALPFQRDALPVPVTLMYRYYVPVTLMYYVMH